ncbi:uncharacterized protein SCDLUD_002947 [Saccharomycodes ludwigii]|uniref:uncharacterized protein n=1 Tax=Saccharomycodes ludwigii TaxID=36035 RepID=UPI001E84A8D7|nr:hypothetical protein SCDLUD_002947 [Saccharomycodes ludwigii]KAH3901452.1 hypothetical protein SCDLUD_002947 [Saccharomycodes ludwigii]
MTTLAENTTKCPNCKSDLVNCLINQNQSLVICPNQQCLYPFDQNRVDNEIFYVTNEELSKIVSEKVTMKDIFNDEQLKDL